MNTRSWLVTGIVLIELVGWQAAEARLAGEYYLGVTAEDHSDASNEFSSLLGIRINDDLVSPKFETQ